MFVDTQSLRPKFIIKGLSGSFYDRLKEQVSRFGPEGLHSLSSRKGSPTSIFLVTSLPGP